MKKYKEEDVCEYWTERDDEDGSYELCKKTDRKCACCGLIKNCDLEVKNEKNN